MPSRRQTIPTCAPSVSFAAAAAESGAGVIAQLSGVPPPSGVRTTPVDDREETTPRASPLPQVSQPAAVGRAAAQKDESSVSLRPNDSCAALRKPTTNQAKVSRRSLLDGFIPGRGLRK